jgi:hypothetical protein
LGRPRRRGGVAERGQRRVVVELARLLRGLRVAIVPESAAREHADDLHALRVVRPGMRGRLALAWRADGRHGAAAP